ncbi:MAG: Type pantothenate kinase, partial [Bacteroidota bacterium]
MKTLCLDLGNTRMKAALFENGQLLSSHVLENDGVDTVDALLNEHKPERSI